MLHNYLLFHLGREQIIDLDPLADQGWLFLGIGENNLEAVRNVILQSPSTCIIVVMAAPAWQLKSLERKLQSADILFFSDEKGELGRKIKVPAYPFFVKVSGCGKITRQFRLRV